MTYGDVIIAIEGYNERQLDDWRRTRLIAHTTYCSIQEKGKKRKIDKWLPLPGDEGFKDKPEMDHTDRIARLQAFKEKVKK